MTAQPTWAGRFSSRCPFLGTKLPIPNVRSSVAARIAKAAKKLLAHLRAYCSRSVWLLNALILVISAYHHSSKDGLAFSLAHATREEEGQRREDCTHDSSDGR